MISGHGGNIYEMAQQIGCDPSEIVDMSSNVNPLGPPSGLLNFLRERICEIRALPEVDAQEVIRSFAARYQVPPELVLAGNGTTQFIYTIPRALESENACIIGPTYADYADACIMNGVSHDHLISDDEADFQPDLDQIHEKITGYDTVFVCNPNNPTGVLIPADEIEKLCRSHPETWFVIDESYLPFVPRSQDHSVLNRGIPNAIVLNSMSKIFRVPGLRTGFLIAPETVIGKFLHYMLPWSVNSLAQAAVTYLMMRQEETDGFVDTTVRFLEKERQAISDAFETISGIRFFSSTTSFMLARLDENHTADEICRHLARHKILIRNCANFRGLSDRFIRISLKQHKENQRLAEKLLLAMND